MKKLLQHEFWCATQHTFFPPLKSTDYTWEVRMANCIYMSGFVLLLSDRTTEALINLLRVILALTLHVGHVHSHNCVRFFFNHCSATVSILSAAIVSDSWHFTGFFYQLRLLMYQILKWTPKDDLPTSFRWQLDNDHEHFLSTASRWNFSVPCF